jgi:hypothetical protein
MSVTIRWDDPDQTILLYEFTSPIHWNDYYAAGDLEWDWMDQADDRIDIIMDWRQVPTLPKETEQHLRNADAHVHRNRGLIVLVGSDDIIQQVASIFHSLYPQSRGDVILASTLTRARSFIAAQYAQRAPELKAV